MTINPAGLSLGPVLAVTTGAATVPVPAALMAQTLLAAAERLAARAAKSGPARRTLRALTTYRAEDLLQGPARPAAIGPASGRLASDDGHDVPDGMAGGSGRVRNRRFLSSPGADGAGQAPRAAVRPGPRC